MAFNTRGFIVNGNPAPQNDSLCAISDELRRARYKFPRNSKLLAALMEEVGELAQAMLQKKPREVIEKECIQVACVAVRLLEEGDSDFDETIKQWDGEGVKP